MQIENRPTADLRAYDRSARTHSDEQIAQIAGSIAEFGFTNPILIGADDVIIAGHGRLLAAQSLGMAEIPTIVLDHLSDGQRRALVIAPDEKSFSSVSSPIFACKVLTSTAGAASAASTAPKTPEAHSSSCERHCVI